MKCNNSTTSQTGLLFFLLLCTLSVTSVMVLSGCFNTLVNSPQDIIKISKLLSTQERRIKAKDIAMVNAESHKLYSIVETLLSKKGYVVRRYKYNSVSKQYHNNDLFFKIKSPDNSKGAVIASRIDYTNPTNRITMVFIEPMKNNKQTTQVKVRVSNDKFVNSTELLNSILDKTGTLEGAPSSAPTDSTSNSAKDAANAALENLDKELAE